MDHITRVHVRDALLHLSRDRTPSRTPLAELEVVRRRLEAAGFRASRDACTYEVGRLLTDVVEDELRHLRTRSWAAARASREHGSTEPRSAPAPEDGMEGDADQREPARGVLEDFRTGQHDLESWSAIYHLYLRPDLGLSLRSLEALLGDRHRRTIQRRLRTGTERLTLRLQALEHEAREQSKRERLQAALPPSTAGPLFGADETLRRVLHLLEGPVRSDLTAIGGPPGSGKTSLALRAVEASCAMFVDVVWLSAAASPDGQLPADRLAQEVAQRCGLAAETLAEASRGLAHGRRLVVLDDLNSARNAVAVADVCCHMPPPCSFLLVGRVGWCALPGVRAVDVPPLGTRDAVAMLRSEAAARGVAYVGHLDDVALARVADAASGHPLALRLAVSELRHGAVEPVVAGFRTGSGAAGRLYERLWSSQWSAVSSAARQVVRDVAATEPLAVGADDGSVAHRARRSEEAATEAIREAIDAGLLRQASTREDGQPGWLRCSAFLPQYLALSRQLGAIRFAGVAAGLAR